MRVTPVFIMNSAGLWLFEFVWHEWMNASLSTCPERCGKRSEVQVPLSPLCCHANGDFISGPTEPGKKPVLLSKPASSVPSRLASSGL